jgi:prevent-host-death family protein
MIREVTAMEARRNLGELLNEVRYGKNSILIKRAGKPIAAIIDVSLLERIRGQLDEAYTGTPKDVCEK